MPEREIAALLALLDDENPGIATAARGRLVALGGEALPALELATYSDDPRLRRRSRSAKAAILAEFEERAFTARLRCGDLDLESCALALAKTDRPELDESVVHDRLQALAVRVRARADVANTPQERASALGAVLHGEDGFRGNSEDYYHPHNSYVDWVLDIRKGIPISLSMLYVFVGRRAGLDVFGVGFPRHFVAGFREGEFVAYLDAFHGGKALDRGEAEQLLLQQNLPAHASLFVEAAPYDIVRRMLANLAYAYRDRRDVARSARTSRFLAALEAGRTKA